MGAIRDFTNSFDIPFVIGGLSFLTSALMHFALMWMNRNEKKNSKKVDDQTSADPVAVVA